MNDTSATARLLQPPRLAYRLLGPLQVLVDGRPVALPGSKPRAVLAGLLINRNAVVSTGHLIASVWNDDPPQAAASGLQVAVSSVRRVIRATGAPDPLTTVAPGYRMFTDPTAVDLDVFLSVRARARIAMSGGDAWQAAAGFAEALRQWTGEPLADLRGLRFADEFAAAWQEERLITLQDRIECDLRCNRHEQVIGELMSLTGTFPLREALWAQLIIALNRSGRQADALDAARRLRTTLSDELGIDPSAELQALEQRVLRQEPETARQGSAGTFLETISEAVGPARGELFDESGHIFAVTTRGCRIGRLPTSEIVIDSGRVSRLHAVVVDTGNAFVITDMNSTNGTKVGASRVIGSRELVDGDVIAVGDTRLTFRSRTS